jgi:Trypsin-like peptidase domain
MLTEAEAGEEAIKQSIVQILDPVGTVRGCGLLVEKQHVLTCAHVLALAIPGVDGGQSKKPSETVRVVFPFQDFSSIDASVVLWKPVREQPPLDLVEDIALLSLEQSPPELAIPHSLLNQGTWAGREYMALGFTESEPNGAYADGKFKGQTVTGWIQLLAEDGQDLQIDHGFSGSGVWDVRARQFAGLIVANRARGGNLKSISYMIPTIVLKRAWKELPLAKANSSSQEVSSCTLDILNINVPYASSTSAEVRCALTNTGDQRIILPCLNLDVVETKELHRSLSTKTASKIDTAHLRTKITPQTKSVQLLDELYGIEPGDIQGFVIKIDAEEGYSYRLELNAKWSVPGGTQHQLSSSIFEIAFPYHSLAGLKQLSERLRRAAPSK